MSHFLLIQMENDSSSNEDGLLNGSDLLAHRKQRGDELEVFRIKNIKQHVDKCVPAI